MHRVEGRERKVSFLVSVQAAAAEQTAVWTIKTRIVRAAEKILCKKKMGVLARHEEENGHTKGAVSIRVAVRLPHRQTSGLRICPSRFRLKFGVEKREFFFFFFFIVFDVFVWFLKFFFPF